MLRKYSERVSQPQEAVGVDWGNPLASGLSVAVIGGIPYNNANNSFPGVTGSLTPSVSRMGRGWTGASGAYIDLGSGFNPGSVGATALQIINPGSVTNQFSWSTRSGAAAAGWELLLGSGAAGRATVRCYDGTEDTAGPITGLNDGRSHIVICRYEPSVRLDIFADTFANTAASTTGIAASLSSSQNLRLHSRATAYYTGSSGDFLYWNRTLSDAEVSLALYDYYQIFAPRPVWLNFSEAAASPISNKPLLRSSTKVSATPSIPTIDTSWIRPIDLWVPIGNTVPNLARDRHARSLGSSVSIVPGALGDSVNNVYNNNRGAFTPSYNTAQWYTGLQEITLFAVATLRSTTAGVSNSQIAHLMRLDGNASPAIAQVDLGVLYDGTTLKLCPLVSTNTNTGWSASMFTTVSSNSAIELNKPYLYMFRYRNGSGTQITATKLGSTVAWTNAALTNTGTVNATSSGSAEMHIGGLANTGEYAWPGNIYMAGVLPYYITDSAANKLANNPYSIFTPTYPFLQTAYAPKAPWSVAKSRVLGTSTGAPATVATAGIVQVTLKSQPQDVAKVNWGTPLIAGLVEVLLPTAHSAGINKTITGVGTRIIDAAGTAVTATPAAAITSTRARTAAWSRLHVFRVQSLAVQHNLSVVTGGANAIQLLVTTGGAIRLDLAFSSIRYSSVNVISALKTYTLLMVNDGAGVVGGIKCYLNGRDIGFVTYQTSSTTTGTALKLADATSGGGSTSVDFFLHADWNRCLSPAEATSVSTNPWQIFAPNNTNIWTPT